jgi:uncharacterized membrane protein YeiH
MLPEFFASQSPTAASVPVPVWLDLAAVIVGSFSGLFYARERQLDILGYIGLAILCGLGGGLVRDTIMQVGDVYMLKSQWPISVAIATGVVGFLFPSIITSRSSLMEWSDIISVGLFAAAGTDKAILYQLLPIPIVFMGTITGVGGGMMRDVFLGDVPHIFRRSNLYATCAIAGSLSYYLSVMTFGLDKAWAAVICVALTAGLRMASLHYDIYSPADVDLGPTVRKTAYGVARAAREVTENEVEHACRQYERRKNHRGDR